MNAAALFWFGLFMGAGVAALFTWLWMRGRLLESRARLEAAQAQANSSALSAEKLKETFQALADGALRGSQSAFLDSARGTLETVRAQISGEMAQKHTAMEGLVRPLTDSLGRLDGHIRTLEIARQQAFGGLQEQLQSLQRETATLSQALRAPQARGRWGETTLRRVAELAGMVRYCDFYEQETLDGAGARSRPDMIVRLPGNQSIAVDAKAPLTGYMEAAAASDEEGRRQGLRRHSQQVCEHVRLLSGRAYWNQFQPAPEIVVLFLPGDHFLSAALEFQPNLLEEAIDKKVLLATPATLIAVLKGIAFGWRQQQLAESAAEIRQVASEFYERVQIVQRYHSETGRCLEKTVEAYNKSVASWEARLMPALRRIHELGATSAGEPEAPAAVGALPRESRAWE